MFQDKFLQGRLLFPGSAFCGTKLSIGVRSRRGRGDVINVLIKFCELVVQDVVMIKGALRSVTCPSTSSMRHTYVKAEENKSAHKTTCSADQKARSVQDKFAQRVEEHFCATSCPRQDRDTSLSEHQRTSALFCWCLLCSTL